MERRRGGIGRQARFAWMYVPASFMGQLGRQTPEKLKDRHGAFISSSCVCMCVCDIFIYLPS